jgi:trans-aconitate methyltransferase
VWLAERTAFEVDAFDPAPAMLAEARMLARTNGVEQRIRFIEADIGNYSSDHLYEMVFAHDVLCYSCNRYQDLESLAARATAGGWMSVTDYWMDQSVSSNQEVLRSCAIQEPPPFLEQKERFQALHANVLFFIDTTSEYRRHWAHLNERLAQCRPQAVSLLGADAVGTFENQILSILQAVDSSRFGHFWSVMSFETTEKVDKQ